MGIHNRYAFVANSAWYLKNFRSNTIKRFQNYGSVTCITSNDLNLGEGVEHLSININSSSTNPIKELVTLVNIFVCIVKSRARIVFSFNPKTNLYSMLACMLLRRKIVVNISGVGTASELNGLLGKVYKKINFLLLKNTDYIFFQNHDDYSHYISSGYIDVSKVEIIPGSGVDISKFSPVKSNSSNIRFLLAARLIKPKGIVEYLQSGLKLSEEFNNFKVILAGVLDTSTRAVDKRVIDEYTRYDWFQFLGMRNDMDRVLDDIDCVVLPSYYPEGTPRSLLEAAAAGKVIITTDTPGCRDVVIEGVNGFLVPPRDTKALTEAMEKVINLSDEKLAEMQANSRKLAEEKYDEQYVIQRYLDVAEEILAKKSKK
ncbi:glycosyltransferase family 4 protein [Cobetia marina]|uniref:glycosyltransferase family 4 protein n=1 Tax=Cobetia marina TaxID=28258 RepID=UPI003A93979A